MNIFYIDENPKQCAEWFVDKHVNKMLIETAQLLSTAHRILDGEQVVVHLKHKETGKVRKKNVWILPDDRNESLYACTHWNRPAARWVRESVENYNWLVDHLYWLGQEYTYRYGKKHATIERCFYQLQSPPFGLRAWDRTELPITMDETYIISDDPVVNYRNYYVRGKSHLKSYKKRDEPIWWSEYL